MVNCNRRNTGRWDWTLVRTWEIKAQGSGAIRGNIHCNFRKVLNHNRGKRGGSRARTERRGGRGTGDRARRGRAWDLGRPRQSCESGDGTAGQQRPGAGPPGSHEVSVA